MTSVAATQFLPVATTATMVGRSLIASVHDVAPATWEASRKIISELRKHGINTCSLLVVPDYHHRGSSMENQPFVSWLRELEGQGYEIVVHGFFHERPRDAGESLVSRFVTRTYTQDEGEFYDLPYDEALQRITSAREGFEAVGLKPRGFIAPAWLLGPEAERAVSDAGLEYTTRLRSVHDLRSGDTFRAWSLVYSAHNQWRRDVSLCWNSMLAQVAQRNWLVRLSIHPVDYTHPAIWNQICQFLTKMRSERTPTTYHDWTIEWRIRRSTGL